MYGRTYTRRGHVYSIQRGIAPYRGKYPRMNKHTYGGIYTVGTYIWREMHMKGHTHRRIYT